jgi:hypothetical protein
MPRLLRLCRRRCHSPLPKKVFDYLFLIVVAFLVDFVLRFIFFAFVADFFCVCFVVVVGVAAVFAFALAAVRVLCLPLGRRSEEARTDGARCCFVFFVAAAVTTVPLVGAARQQALPSSVLFARTVVLASLLSSISFPLERGRLPLDCCGKSGPRGRKEGESSRSQQGAARGSS